MEGILYIACRNIITVKFVKDERINVLKCFVVSLANYNNPICVLKINVKILNYDKLIDKCNN